jgi:hypothetical protein
MSQRSGFIIDSVNILENYAAFFCSKSLAELFDGVLRWYCGCFDVLLVY